MKIAVIGTGNVATQFAKVFGTECISSRTLDNLPANADLYIIAVSDSAVQEVAESLPELRGIVVHTTGSVPMDALQNVKCGGRGVFYPFQTISKSRPLPPSSIPILIESDSEDTAQFLEKTAKDYGFTDISRADSDMRRKVHLAGIFVSNFPNAMISIAQKILEECGINGKIVTPLVSETIEKLKTLPAKEAQTGPAMRKDTPTIEKHLAILQNHGMQDESEIYDLVSRYIITHISNK